MFRRLILSSVSALVVAGSLGFVGAAGAAPLGHLSGLTWGSSALRAGRSSSPSTEKNPYYAGYYLESSASSGTVTSTITVPRVKSCTAATRAIVPGTGIVVTNSKTEWIDVAGVFVGCVKGHASYYPVLLEHNKEKNYSSVKIQAGDKVVMTVSTSAASSALSVVDKTHKSASKKLTGAGVTGVDSPAIFDWPWFTGGLLVGPEPSPARVPNFGNVQFSASKFAGQPFDSSTNASNLVRYVRYAYNFVSGEVGKLQITANPFSSATSFKTIYKHS